MKLSKSELQLETVVSRITGGELDLQPNFQRGEIWDMKRKQRLVDTILRNWYVPAVHIVVESDGSEVVLDGQQRLATIRDFVSGKVRVDGHIDPPNPEIQELHGKKYSQLPEPVRKAVNRFVIQVITLTDFQPQEPNELFFRLNQSYNLTPPEKRNALHGTARDQVRALVDRMASEGLLNREVIGFSNGRLAYDDIVARTCVAVELNTLRRHINNTVVEEFYRSSEFSERTVDAVAAAGRTLLEQVMATGGSAKFNKGTLQTWLVYCYWASAVAPLPPTLFEAFEGSRRAVRAGSEREFRAGDEFLSEILRIYSDRSSYRVTDVSSVVSRDLAIHVLAEAVYDFPARRGSGRLLAQLREAPAEEIGALFSEFLEQSAWGDPILGGDELR